MNDKLKSLLTSRRFWVAAAGLVAVVGQEAFGVTLSTDQIIAVGGIVVAWILGDTIRETK